MKKSQLWIVAATIAAIGAIVVISFELMRSGTTEDPVAQLAREHGIENYYEVNGFLRDRVELEPGFQRIVADVNNAVDKELEGRERGLGFIHEWEREKQRILKERHGFTWRTSGEMNPWVCID